MDRMTLTFDDTCDLSLERALVNLNFAATDPVVAAAAVVAMPNFTG
jgi:hypothetical protein